MKIKKLLFLISIPLIPVSSVFISSCSNVQNNSSKPSETPDSSGNNSENKPVEPPVEPSKPIIPPAPSLDEIKMGGQIPGTSLQCNKFLKIIELLNINDNDILNKTLDTKTTINNIEYKDISLKLIDADISTGVANFSIFGTYKGIPVDDKIQISGFNTALKFKSFYSDFPVVINWDKVFNNKQTNASINTWTFENLFNYLTSFEVLTQDNKNINLCELYNNKEIVPSSNNPITISNNKLVSLNIVYRPYSYNNNEWKQINISNNIQFNNCITDFQYTNQQANDYILNNKVIPMNNIAKKYLSWYYGTFNNTSDFPLLNFLFEVDKSYYDLYTPNALLLINDIGTIKNINNGLEISVKLINNDIVSTKTFTIPDILLSESDYINQQKWNMQITFREQNDKISILKSIKKEIINLDLVNTNNKIDLNYKYMGIFGGTNNKIIYNSNLVDNKISNNNKYSYTIFNTNLDNINLNTNILNDIVGIDIITISNNSCSAYIQKVNNNYYYVQPITFNINFLANPTPYTINGELYFNFLASDFNSN